MSTYRVVFKDEAVTDWFDTEAEAEEAGRDWVSEYSDGMEYLNMQNPGDYECDEEGDYGFAIEEHDEETGKTYMIEYI